MAGSNLFTGTLDLLILQTVKWGPKHGYAIGRWISERTGGTYDLEEGVLYPALHRLQAKGFVDWEWRKTEEGKRAKYYEISRKGRHALSGELERWVESTRAMLSLLQVPMEEVK